MFKTFLWLATVASLLVIPANAADIQWFDLSGWDAVAVTGDGQLFEDVCGSVDMTVTGTPAHSPESYYRVDIDAIQTGGNNDQHSFTFDFTSVLDLVVEVRSLDGNESLWITSNGGSSTYTHTIGALPTESAALSLTGNGFEFGPTGASRGYVTLTDTSSFTWDYIALADDKWESFRIGCVETVPEPRALSLFAVAGFALLGFRRQL